MRKPCTTPLSGTGGACSIIPVRPGRSGAKSKDALFVLATVLMVVALAGCGGGGKTAAPLMPVTGLPDNLTLTGDSFTIRAGESRRVGDADGVRTELRCPADGPDCDVTVGADGAARYTGGKPEVVTVPYTAIQLPEGELMLTEGLTTIDPGKSLVLQQTFDTRTELMCPEGGEPCMVTLTEDGAAESTGGAPTVVTYTTLYLPSGHTLAEGTTIPAGGTLPIGGYSRGRSYQLVCPFDGEACELTLGEFDFESTGGTPYVELAAGNEIVWQANNGPDGTSNGAHARGLEGRIVRGSSLNQLNPLYGSGQAQRPQRRTAVVLNTRATASVAAHTVAPTASWATADAAPTLGLSVTGTGSNTFAVDGDSVVPSIGTGWNGVALKKTVPTDRTARAVLYSDITQTPDGGSADTFYMTFGAWLVTPDSSTAASTSYDLGVFAVGSTGVLDNFFTHIRPLTGTATYQGPATGLYSAATYTGTGATRALESAEVGYFTATVTVGVDFATGSTFGGTSVSVTNFMENGESLGDWTVNFLNTTTNRAGEQGLFIGGINGGASTADGRRLGTGNYGVQFHRSSASGHPDWAVGTFTASTLGPADDALHIAGAYAAERQ